MSRSRLKPLLIACIGLTLCTAIGIENLSIDRLVSASDLIAIADVLDVSDVGPAPPLVFRGQKLSAEAYNVELTVTDIIKGSATGRVLVKYALPASFVGYQGLHRGVRLVFLRKGDTGYTVADPYYPDLPAVGMAPESYSKLEPGDYARSVVREMLAVIASDSATPAQKSEILRVAYALPSNAEAISAFKSGVAAARDPELEQRLQGELIRLEDISELPKVAHTLVGDLATENQRVWLLYVVGNDLKSPLAIPALEPLLRSNDNSNREAGAEALWHIADPSALPSIAKALQDPDEQVRFYAVRACADIANEPDWGGPGEAEFHQHEQKYLTHWEDWIKISEAGQQPPKSGQAVAD
ncbi:MAG: HEAT repeat domain-containing protein [Candidatus Sulfotelmatobacter sp.]